MNKNGGEEKKRLWYYSRCSEVLSKNASALNELLQGTVRAALQCLQCTVKPSLVGMIS